TTAAGFSTAATRRPLQPEGPTAIRSFHHSAMRSSMRPERSSPSTTLALDQANETSSRYDRPWAEPDETWRRYAKAGTERLFTPPGNPMEMVAAREGMPWRALPAFAQPTSSDGSATTT